MRLFLCSGLTALAILGSSALLWAEDGPPRGERPGPAELFGKLDSNQDGEIVADEVEGDKRRMFEHLLRSADKNSDGKLSKEEFVAGVEAHRQREREGRPGGTEGRGPEGRFNPEEMFKKLDANGDGKVELSEVPEEGRARFERMLEHADENKNKSIDAEEFKASMARMRERFAQSGRPGGDRPRPDGPRREGGPRDGDRPRSEARDGDRPRPEGPPREGGPREGGRRPPGMPIVRALDANADGEISADEIAGASAALAKLDKNGDGKLTPDEIAPPGPPPRVEGRRFGREGDRPRPDGPRREGRPEREPRREGDRKPEEAPRGERRPEGEDKPAEKSAGKGVFGRVFFTSFVNGNAEATSEVAVDESVQQINVLNKDVDKKEKGDKEEKDDDDKAEKKDSAGKGGDGKRGYHHKHHGHAHSKHGHRSHRHGSYGKSVHGGKGHHSCGDHGCSYHRDHRGHHSRHRGDNRYAGPGHGKGHGHHGGHHSRRHHGRGHHGGHFAHHGRPGMPGMYGHHGFHGMHGHSFGRGGDGMHSPWSDRSHQGFGGRHSFGRHHGFGGHHGYSFGAHGMHGGFGRSHASHHSGYGGMKSGFGHHWPHFGSRPPHMMWGGFHRGGHGGPHFGHGGKDRKDHGHRHRAGHGDKSPSDHSGREHGSAGPKPEGHESAAAGPGSGRGFDASHMVARMMGLDKDKDGKISAEEAMSPAKEHFAAVDTNGDKQLDEGELKAHAEKMMERFRAAAAKFRAEHPRGDGKRGPWGHGIRGRGPDKPKPEEKKDSEGDKAPAKEERSDAGPPEPEAEPVTNS